MNRVWSIIEIEDQTKDITFLNEVNITFIQPYSSHFNHDAYCVEKDFDIPEKGLNVTDSIDALEIIDYDNEDLRLKVFGRIASLSYAWNIFNMYLLDVPIDIISLDIKLNEADVVKTDQLKKIISEYKNSLSSRSDAYNQGDDNMEHFLRNGGMILWSRINRLITEKKKKGKSSILPPLIIIQTASEAIDSFSVLEYAFPYSVKIISKKKAKEIHNGKNLIQEVLELRIFQLINSGEIDLIKLKEVLQKIKSPKYYENLAEIKLYSLNNEEEGWKFGTLFPWLYDKLTKRGEENNIQLVVNELEKYLVESDYTTQLYDFFESPETAIAQFTHPLERDNRQNCNYSGLSLRDLIEQDKVEEVNNDFKNNIPPLIKRLANKFEQNSTSDGFRNNEIILEELIRAFVNRPMTRKEITDELEQLRTGEDCRLKIFKNQKEELRQIKVGRSEFRKHEIFKAILSKNLDDMQSSINLSLYDFRKDNHYNENEFTENLLSITDSGIEIDNIEVSHIYFPWEQLDRLIQQILTKVKERSEYSKKPLKIKVGLFYSNNKEKFYFIINPDLPFINLENAAFNSDRRFDPPINTLRSWCDIYIGSGSVERSTHLKPEVGTTFMEEEVYSGTRYLVIIPAKLKREIQL